ncbi:MAG: hypothetical protein ACRCTY_09380 [Candidatus Adiutrix sp.]
MSTRQGGGFVVVMIGGGTLHCPRGLVFGVNSALAKICKLGVFSYYFDPQELEYEVIFSF